MTEEEFLRRIDGHLEAAKEHMARSNEIMARSDETMAANRLAFAEARAELAGLRQSSDDIRVELRQCSLRGERVAQRFEATVRHIYADIAKNREKDREALDSLLEEGRAGRAALFRILDELKGGQGPAAAGA